MGKGPRYSVPYKRKREDKTDYHKRLALLKSHKTRIVIRKTNKRIIIQAVNFKPIGDKTLFTITNNDLKKYGLKKESNNLPISYLTGYLAGKTALTKKVKEAVLDLGLNISSKGSKLYAALAGLLESGLKINHSKKILPAPERLKGEHIKGFDNKIIDKVKKQINAKVKD